MVIGGGVLGAAIVAMFAGVISDAHGRILLARDPDILEARTRTDKDIFYNPEAGLPRAERIIGPFGAARIASVRCTRDSSTWKTSLKRRRFASWVSSSVIARACIVRPAWNDMVLIKRYLDIGPLIPQVSPGMAAAVQYGTAQSVRWNFSEEEVLGKTGTCSNNGTRYGWFASVANTAAETAGGQYTVTVTLSAEPTGGNRRLRYNPRQLGNRHRVVRTYIVRLARLATDLGGIGNAVAAHPDRVVHIRRQIRDHVAALIVGDDDLDQLRG